MTLHEAIVQLLKQRGRAMTTSEIADELNQNKWYTKKDGSLITAFQIHGRTRNYSHLFQRDGSLVTLIDQAFNGFKEKSSIKESKPIKQVNPNPSVSYNDLDNTLMDEVRFKSADSIDSEVPPYPGLYCIRIKQPSRLPGVFARELNQRGNNIIYIGKASKNLNRRLLKQELRATGHGTFFRSIGSVLGYKPPNGSLVLKKNKRNFKFTPVDEAEIIQWINESLLVSWVEFYGDIPQVESELILKYKPLFNIDGNPYAMEELRNLRAECTRIANTSQ